MRSKQRTPDPLQDRLGSTMTGRVTYLPWWNETSSMDYIDPYGTLRDGALQAEIILLADLMEAAAHADRQLAIDELDRALGLLGSRDQEAAAPLSP